MSSIQTLYPLQSLVFPSLADGKVVLLIVDCSRKDFVDAVAPYIGREVLDPELTGARWTFLICSPAGKQAAPLQTEPEAVTAFLQFVDAYAATPLGNIQIFLLVDLELEGSLWELGSKRFLEVCPTGGIG